MVHHFRLSSPHGNKSSKEKHFWVPRTHDVQQCLAAIIYLFDNTIPHFVHPKQDPPDPIGMLSSCRWSRDLDCWTRIRVLRNVSIKNGWNTHDTIQKYPSHESSEIPDVHPTNPYMILFQCQKSTFFREISAQSRGRVLQEILVQAGLAEAHHRLRTFKASVSQEVQETSNTEDSSAPRIRIYVIKPGTFSQGNLDVFFNKIKMGMYRFHEFDYLFFVGVNGFVSK